MRFLLLSLLVLAACRPDARSANDLLAAAQQHADAVEISDAVGLYKKAAAKGSTDAMFKLDTAYRHGTLHTSDGWVAGMIQKDTAAADRYRTQALDSLEARAERGDADAWARWLAATWSERPGPRNAATIQRAADAGSPVAMGLSALALYRHDGTPETDSLFADRARRPPKRAIRWGKLDGAGLPRGHGRRGRCGAAPVLARTGSGLRRRACSA